MIQRKIVEELTEVAARYRRQRQHRILAVIWLLAAIVGLGLFVANVVSGWHSEWSVPLLAGGAALASFIVVALSSRCFSNRLWVARKVEEQYPELDAKLLAALEQKPELPEGRFGFLQHAVLTEVLQHARKSSWRQIVPDGALRQAYGGSLIALLSLALVVSLLLGSKAPEPLVEVASPPASDDVDDVNIVEPPTYEVEIDPGNVEIERGAGLLIMARFPKDVPTEVTLVLAGGG